MGKTRRQELGDRSRDEFVLPARRGALLITRMMSCLDLHKALPFQKLCHIFNFAYYYYQYLLYKLGGVDTIIVIKSS